MFKERGLDLYSKRLQEEKGNPWHLLDGGINEVYMAVRDYDLTKDPITPIYPENIERLNELSTLLVSTVGEGAFWNSKVRTINSNMSKMHHSRNLHVLGTTISSAPAMTMALMKRATDIFWEFQRRCESVHGDEEHVEDCKFIYPFSNVAVLQMTDLQHDEYTIDMMTSRVLQSDIVQQLYCTVENRRRIEVINVYFLFVTGMKEEEIERTRYNVHSDRISNPSVSIHILSGRARKMTFHNF